ncbi:MAG: dephospho-CoA kinase [Chloroflexi bacterium]|nr:dephospho-CoA kinase [Chloroflexota bacterium]MCL5275864.1 dephospho-CoA kinase [Chloroflexota bacterium]
MPPRILIGLTGNIATGKSAVAQVLRELGAAVIDADQVSRQVVNRGEPALAAIIAKFGAGILLPDGELDRNALGQIVFNDPDKLMALEAIVHPAVHVAMTRQLAALSPDRVAVIEVIKLFESGWAEQCDQVWVTDCPPEVQAARLAHSRGMSEAEARSRVAAQNPQSEKLRRADVVIDTSGTHEQTRRQVRAAWLKIAIDSPAESAPDAGNDG